MTSDELGDVTSDELGDEACGGGMAGRFAQSATNFLIEGVWWWELDGCVESKREHVGIHRRRGYESGQVGERVRRRWACL